MTSRRRRRAPSRRRASRQATGSPIARGGASFWRVLLVVAMSLCALVAILAFALSVWSRRAGPNQNRMVALQWPEATGPETTGPEATAALLKKHGLIENEALMALYLATLGRVGPLRPGPHLIPSGASPRELVGFLASLPGRQRISVSIPEGFEHLRIAERLEQKGVCSAQAFVKVARDREILGELGIKGRNAEGYLFPATYELYLDASPRSVLEKMVRETRTRLRAIEAKVAPGSLARLAEQRGWGEYEVLTLASMVEREARVDEERPLIAQVFLNRLDDPSFRPLRMLQSDPTALYGCLIDEAKLASCAGGAKRATPAILRDPLNPYNTYRHPGLPPGPVANPGAAALKAVLLPTKTDFLYFVAGGDGRHRFSRTYDEHKKAIPR